MADSLTPEQLAAIQSYYTTNGDGASPYRDQSGRYFIPYTQTSGVTEASDGTTDRYYIGADNLLADWKEGNTASTYDLQGNKTSDFSVDDPNATDWGGMLALGLIAAMTGGAVYGALGGAGTGAGIAGPGEAGWGMGLDSVTGGSGALEAMGGVGAGGVGTTSGVFNAAVDSQAANAAIEAAGGDALGGYTAAGTGGVTASPVVTTAVPGPGDPGWGSGLDSATGGSGAETLSGTPITTPTGSTWEQLLTKITSMSPSEIASLLAGVGSIAGNAGSGSGGGGGYDNYQGGIPTVSYSRTQLPVDLSRRPGSAPQAYFSGDSYAPGPGTINGPGSGTGGGSTSAPAPAGPTQGVVSLPNSPTRGPRKTHQELADSSGQSLESIEDRIIDDPRGSWIGPMKPTLPALTPEQSRDFWNSGGYDIAQPPEAPEELNTWRTRLGLPELQEADQNAQKLMDLYADVDKPGGIVGGNVDEEGWNYWLGRLEAGEDIGTDFQNSVRAVRGYADGGLATLQRTQNGIDPTRRAGSAPQSYFSYGTAQGQAQAPASAALAGGAGEGVASIQSVGGPNVQRQGHRRHRFDRDDTVSTRSIRGGSTAVEDARTTAASPLTRAQFGEFAPAPGSANWADDQYLRANDYWRDYAENIAGLSWEDFATGGGAAYGYTPGTRGYMEADATPFLDTAYNTLTDPNRGTWFAPGQSGNFMGFERSGYAPGTAPVGMAAGGVASLSGGRYLQGPGDGLSDEIPATIEGKQPARLANNEFVVSADVVSALGGGSSEAGAKKLYKMMDRIRQQAHGHKKQVRPVDDSALPA